MLNTLPVPPWLTAAMLLMVNMIEFDLGVQNGRR
jgi:hypothetical protein